MTQTARSGASGITRAALSFRSVNHRLSADFDDGLQRHHLLPVQLVSSRCFGRLFDALGRDRIGFDDFRSNGLLLPCRESAALQLAMPLHRGPHRNYNALVIERVGQVETAWAASRARQPDKALEDALMRLGLLQKALRRRLLDSRRRWSLNRYDPAFRVVDFSELDALAGALWPATESVLREVQYPADRSASALLAA